jgi:hypothetical protein
MNSEGDWGVDVGNARGGVGWGREGRICDKDALLSRQNNARRLALFENGDGIKSKGSHNIDHLCGYCVIEGTMHSLLIGKMPMLRLSRAFPCRVKII